MKVSVLLFKTEHWVQGLDGSGGLEIKNKKKGWKLVLDTVALGTFVCAIYINVF